MDYELLRHALSEFGTVRRSPKRKNIIKVLLEEDNSERRNILEQIAVKLNRKVEETDAWLSSVGHIKVGQFRIVVKPKDQQDDGSAGLGNELTFFNEIKERVKTGPINLIFAGGNGHSFWANNVIDVERVGGKTESRAKSDIHLKSSNNFIYKLSLKKDNSKIWESADTLLAGKAKAAIEHAIQANVVQLVAFKTVDGKLRRTQDGQVVLKLSKEIVTEANITEKLAVVFGSDIRQDGAILKKTFKPEDFIGVEGNNTILVDCSKVYTNLAQIEGGEDDVMICIRNDCTRNNKKLAIPGIRVNAVYESKVRGSKRIHLDK